jgi:hypothetical protein
MPCKYCKEKKIENLDMVVVSPEVYVALKDLPVKPDEDFLILSSIANFLGDDPVQVVMKICCVCGGYFVEINHVDGRAIRNTDVENVVGLVAL